MDMQDPAPTDDADQPVIVGIASTGRADVLHDTLVYMATLQDAPDAVVVSIAAADDCHSEKLPQAPFPIEVITSPKGSCAQRNTILSLAPTDAIVLFLDDDFLIAEGYITATQKAFSEEPDIVMATGTVAADGIIGPGMDHTEGMRHMPNTGPDTVPLTRDIVYNGYGCNMAVRMAPVHDNGIVFDTELPRYGWLEDVDFSRQLAPFGQIIKDSRMRGVHLGTKTGRSRGIPLGYSQIANPIYMIRKGTMARRKALHLMGRNVAANLAKSFRPEPWVDRKGRVKGNFLALRDMLTRRISPNRILDL